MRPSTISLANAVAMASAVRSQPSRMPNDRCAVSRMLVISSGGRKRVSSRSPCFPFGMGPAAATPVSSVTRFPHDVHLVWRRLLQHLHATRRPRDGRRVHQADGAKSEVETPLILGGDYA